jgi:D-alanine-D-alanine ligase-like ATP-grasp enzyme
MGYPTVPGKAFYGGRWGKRGRDIRAAYEYVKRIGFPVFVKPNNLSQGEGVARVFTKMEFYRAVRFILERDEVFLVQRALPGKDYRLLVLDGEVVSAYERFPLSVEGDGRSILRKLVREKIKKLFRERTDIRARIDDPRIASNMRRLGISWNTVLPRGKTIFLLDNANLSTGGDAVDVFKNIHKGFQKIAVRVTRDMGLRYCGVDLIVDGSISRSPRKYWVLELNAAPGVEYYASSGRENRRRVEDIYLRILKAVKHSRS